MERSSFLHGVGHEGKTYVRRFQEGRNRYPRSVHGCIDPQGPSEEPTSARGTHGTHISDCLPKLEGAGLRTTDRHGTCCRGTVSRARARRGVGHCRLQKNLRLADVHSAGVHCRDCLLRGGAREQDVGEQLQRETQLPDLSTFYYIIMGMWGTKGQRLHGHLRRQYEHDKVNLVGDF